MKQTLIAFSILIGLFVSPIAQAQAKIATVNLQKVFDNYWKTKQISERLQGRGQEYKENREKLMKQYQELNESYAKLQESANDPAASSSERDRRTKDAEAKLLEVKNLERDIVDYDNTTKAEITETQTRMKENIIQQIREKIAQIAKKAGYAFVFDTAAEARTDTPVLLYTDGSNDLTDQVLSSLNAKEETGN